MKKWVVIFLVFSSLFAVAQEDSLSFKHKASVNYKIPLLSWLDITSPSVNFGVEVRLTKRFSLYQEVGYINYRVNKLFYEMEPRKVQGFKINFEPRFHMHTRKNKSLFLTPSIFYKYDNEFIKDAHFWRHEGQYIQLIDYSRIRNMLAITPKFGFQFFNKNKAVGFEVSSGIGFRMLNIAYSKNDIPNDATLSDRFSGTFFLKRDRGTFYRPNFFIGLSIIFRDKNNR